MTEPSSPWPTRGGRIDIGLIRRGLARSRGHARDLIASGAVRVDNSLVTKASALIMPTQTITVAPDAQDSGPQWVGRGAGKLRAAFDTWAPYGLSADGLRCLDVGASTGGFTQVLLAEGAAHVVALDVGHGQLAPTLVADHRVSDLSGTSIRNVPSGLPGAPFDVVVADLSFISLTLVMEPIRRLLAPQGQAVLLIKPQFEVGRAALGKSGIVRSAADRLSCLHRVLRAARANDLPVRDIVHSPVRGGGGNREYLVWVWPGPATGSVADMAVGSGPVCWEDVARRAAQIVGEETG